MDISRTRYIRHLRRERKLSRRGEVDAQLQKSKARLIELWIAEKEGELVSVESMLSLIDEICGTVNSHAYSMAARVSGEDRCRGPTNE